MSIKFYSINYFIILSLMLAACQSTGTQESPEPAAETEVATEVVEATPVEVIQAITPTPEPSGPRTLVICMGQEPESLFSGDEIFQAQIMDAIADGPIDSNSFAYQPVILEKLPNLADGDAVINAVKVKEGDLVVDAYGEVVELEAGKEIALIPAGGGEPVTYQGGEFEMDQLVSIFFMLPDLSWSDGAPLTASDSIYAFNLLADPDTEGDKYLIEHTASYEAPDDLTIVWTGLPGFMDPEYYVNFFGPTPEHAWGKFTAAELTEADFPEIKPIGWGPYMFEEWVRGDHISLVKNPNYFRAGEGLPVFDRVIYRFVGIDSNANIAALLSGQCDIIATLTGLDDEIEQVLELQDEGELKATFTTGTTWAHVDFGIQLSDYDDGYQVEADRPDFFSDVRTRRAFAMCMDRQALVDEIFYGQTTIIDTYLPPQHPYFNPEVTHYEFDVQAGSSLLEEVGWVDADGDPATPRVAENVDSVPDGTELVVNFAGLEGGSGLLAIEMLKDSLAECGIRANIQHYPMEEFYGDGPEGIIFGRNYDLTLFAWLTGVTPPCDLYLSDLTPGPAGETWISIQDGQERVFGMSGWASQNNPGFVDEDYDSACNTGNSSLPGQPQHMDAHLEAQRIFAEQLPVVPLFVVNKLAATRPDFCNFIMDPTSNSEFWNIEEFDYGEGCED